MARVKTNMTWKTATEENTINIVDNVKINPILHIDVSMDMTMTIGQIKIELRNINLKLCMHSKTITFNYERVTKSGSINKLSLKGKCTSSGQVNKLTVDVDTNLLGEGAFTITPFLTAEFDYESDNKYLRVAVKGPRAYEANLRFEANGLSSTGGLVTTEVQVARPQGGEIAVKVEFEFNNAPTTKSGSAQVNYNGSKSKASFELEISSDTEFEGKLAVDSTIGALVGFEFEMERSGNSFTADVEYKGNGEEYEVTLKFTPSSINISLEKGEEFQAEMKLSTDYTSAVNFELTENERKIALDMTISGNQAEALLTTPYSGFENIKLTGNSESTSLGATIRMTGESGAQNVELTAEYSLTDSFGKLSWRVEKGTEFVAFTANSVFDSSKADLNLELTSSKFDPFTLTASVTKGNLPQGFQFSARINLETPFEQIKKAESSVELAFMWPSHIKLTVKAKGSQTFFDVEVEVKQEPDEKIFTFGVLIPAIGLHENDLKVSFKYVPLKITKHTLQFLLSGEFSIYKVPRKAELDVLYTSQLTNVRVGFAYQGADVNLSFKLGINVEKRGPDLVYKFYFGEKNTLVLHESEEKINGKLIIDIKSTFQDFGLNDIKEKYGLPDKINGDSEFILTEGRSECRLNIYYGQLTQIIAKVVLTPAQAAVTVSIDGNDLKKHAAFLIKYGSKGSVELYLGNGPNNAIKMAMSNARGKREARASYLNDDSWYVFDLDQSFSKGAINLKTSKGIHKLSYDLKDTEEFDLTVQFESPNPHISEGLLRITLDCRNNDYKIRTSLGTSHFLSGTLSFDGWNRGSISTSLESTVLPGRQFELTCNFHNYKDEFATSGSLKHSGYFHEINLEVEKKATSGIRFLFDSTLYPSVSFSSSTNMNNMQGRNDLSREHYFMAELKIANGDFLRVVEKANLKFSDGGWQLTSSSDVWTNSNLKATVKYDVKFMEGNNLSFIFAATSPSGDFEELHFDLKSTEDENQEHKMKATLTNRYTGNWNVMAKINLESVPVKIVCRLETSNGFHLIQAELDKIAKKSSVKYENSDGTVLSISLTFNQRPANVFDISGKLESNLAQLETASFEIVSQGGFSYQEADVASKFLWNDEELSTTFTYLLGSGRKELSGSFKSPFEVVDNVKFAVVFEDEEDDKAAVAYCEVNGKRVGLDVQYRFRSLKDFVARFQVDIPFTNGVVTGIHIENYQSNETSKVKLEGKWNNQVVLAKYHIKCDRHEKEISAAVDVIGKAFSFDGFLNRKTMEVKTTVNGRNLDPLINYDFAAKAEAQLNGLSSKIFAAFFKDSQKIFELMTKPDIQSMTLDIPTVAKVTISRPELENATTPIIIDFNTNALTGKAVFSPSNLRLTLRWPNGVEMSNIVFRREDTSIVATHKQNGRVILGYESEHLPSSNKVCLTIPNHVFCNEGQESGSQLTWNENRPNAPVYGYGIGYKQNENHVTDRTTTQLVFKRFAGDQEEAYTLGAHLHGHNQVALTLDSPDFTFMV